jgi:hypothetical protein
MGSPSGEVGFSDSVAGGVATRLASVGSVPGWAQSARAAGIDSFAVIYGQACPAR